jgi:hypothetical protein
MTSHESKMTCRDIAYDCLTVFCFLRIISIQFVLVRRMEFYQLPVCEAVLVLVEQHHAAYL